jgi:plasmid stabilization system protein ParE
VVKLQYSKPALEDLRAIFLYISADSPAIAGRFVRMMKDRIKILKKHPEIGKKFFQGKFTNLRQVLHKTYRIIYLHEDDIVTIITIHHQKRLIENIPAIRKYII